MHVLNYLVKFNTPAFLGNAEQAAQWRTPPIKALLRQWWRVAYAADHGFRGDMNAMRREEGRLFGVASDGEGDSRKSLVRIRLNDWGMGKLHAWPGQDATVSHPEVGKPVGAQLYLGYGPLVFRQGTALKANAAIQAGEAAALAIACPTTHRDAELRRLLEVNVSRLERALLLMDRYGALGGRSRNGWGSFALLPSPAGGGAGGEGATPVLPLRPWRDCLNVDWPHSIGQDERPLIWRTPEFDDWKALMKRLAEIKIGLRRLFLFPNKKSDGEVHDRHWLSYPVTNHNVREWDRNKLRLPNTLRFKVRATADRKLVGVIFHVPHLPPAAFRPNRQDIETVWTQVHRFLDAPAQSLTRIPE